MLTLYPLYFLQDDFAVDKFAESHCLTMRLLVFLDDGKLFDTIIGVVKYRSSNCSCDHLSVVFQL